LTVLREITNALEAHKRSRAEPVEEGRLEP
jgi:hypothetical protein